MRRLQVQAPAPERDRIRRILEQAGGEDVTHLSAQRSGKASTVFLCDIRNDRVDR